MAKVMAAKFSGRCGCCGESFAAGAQIQWNGSAILVSCIEAERARLEAEDRENAARQAVWMAERKAGKHVRTTVVANELVITGAIDYQMARAEAFAFVASVKAAGGSAALRKHRRGGKLFLGREIVTYYGGSNLGHHEGFAFRFEVA